MEKTFEALHLLLSQYKALSILCIAVVLMFPVITTAVMFAERTGFFGNVYQAEHAMLRGLAMEQHELAQGSLLRHDLLRGELIRNRGLIQGAAYFQQRTCINTAQTKDEKDRCVLSIEERKIEE